MKSILEFVSNVFYTVFALISFIFFMCVVIITIYSVLWLGHFVLDLLFG